MKNIKQLVFATMTIFFLGMGSGYAQESVLIKGSFYVGKYAKVITVSPDYKVTESENGKVEENEFLIALKKELDKWIAEGYTVTESGVFSSTPVIYTKFYTLTKKE